MSWAGWVGWGVGAGRGPWVLVWLREPPRLISVPWTGPLAPGCVPGGDHCPCPGGVALSLSPGCVPAPRAELHNRFYTFLPQEHSGPTRPGAGPPHEPQQRLF